MADSTASEWGFTRLIIGLDTALLGLLFYGKEKILHVGSSKWLLSGCVLPLVGSLLALLLAAQFLISVDSWRELATEFRRINPSFSWNTDQEKFLERGRKRVTFCMRTGLWFFSRRADGNVVLLVEHRYRHAPDRCNF